MSSASSLPARLAQGRLKRGQMNDSETKYAAHLAARQMTGDVLWWRFEGLKLRIADGSFYTPDFVVMVADGTIECHEVKGQWMDDARLKIRLASDLYPFRFVALRTVPKSRGGGWEVEDFSKWDAPLLLGLRLKDDVPPPVKRVAKEARIIGSLPGDPGVPWTTCEGEAKPIRRVRPRAGLPSS